MEPPYAVSDGLPILVTQSIVILYPGAVLIVVSIISKCRIDVQSDQPSSAASTAAFSFRSIIA